MKIFFFFLYIFLSTHSQQQQSVNHLRYTPLNLTSRERQIQLLKSRQPTKTNGTPTGTPTKRGRRREGREKVKKVMKKIFKSCSLLVYEIFLRNILQKFLLLLLDAISKIKDGRQQFNNHLHDHFINHLLFIIITIIN